MFLNEDPLLTATDEDMVFIRIRYDWSDEEVRRRMAIFGYCLNILLEDPDPAVSMIAATTLNFIDSRRQIQSKNTAMQKNISRSSKF